VCVCVCVCVSRSLGNPGRRTSAVASRYQRTGEVIADLEHLVRVLSVRNGVILRTVMKNYECQINLVNNPHPISLYKSRHHHVVIIILRLQYYGCDVSTFCSGTGTFRRILVSILPI
jgi:hypothetical protein